MAKYFSKNVFSPLFLQIVHTQSTFLQPATSLWWSRRGHTHTQKKLCILLARKFCQNTRNKKKINLKKEKSRPSEKCFIPFQWSEASKKKRTQKILLLLSSENLKKKSLHKNGILWWTKHKLCMKRHFVFTAFVKFLIRGQYYYPRNKMFLKSRNFSWPFQKPFVRHIFKTVDLSALLNTDAYKKMCVFEKKIIMLLFCQLKYCRGIKLYHDMWKMFFFLFGGIILE